MARAGGQRARQFIRDAAKRASLGSILKDGIGAVFLSVAAALVSGVLTVADVVTIPLGYLAQAVGELIDAIVGGGAFIIETGAQVTGVSLTGPWNVGPLTFAVAIGAVLIGYFVIIKYLEERETGDTFPLIGGFGTDIKFIGVTEEGEEDDS